MISVSRQKIKIICLFQDRLNKVSPLPWLSKISCCGTKRMVWSRVVLKFQVIGRTFSNILKIAPKLIFMWIFSQNNKYAICRINFVWILRFLNHYCNKSRQFVSLRTNLDSMSKYLQAHHASLNALGYFQYSKHFFTKYGVLKRKGRQNTNVNIT